MIRLQQNTLHPAAAYVDESVLTPVDDLSDAEVPDGYERLRVTLPEGSALRPEGWAEVKKTALFRIEPEHFPRLKVKPVEGSDWETWFEAHWAYYMDCSSDNPPVRPANLRRAFGDAIEAGSAVTIGSGFASLRGMRAGIIEAGWIGGTTDEVKTGIKWCLHKAHQIGAKAVEFEADDIDPPLWSALHALSDPTEIFVTYELT